MDDSSLGISEARQEFYRTVKRNLEAWAEDIGEQREYGKYIPLAPDLLQLLERLALDEDVPAASKAEIAVVISYVLAPMDTVPEEMVGPSGYVDDIALAALVVQGIQEKVGAGVVQRHWHRDEDAAEVVEGVLTFANYSMGPKIWDRVKEDFRRQL